MFRKTPRKRTKFGSRAQAMVEFAIALPVLLLLLFGIMEVGRLILMYALVSNASRDAVRYASSVGIESAGAQYQRYKYCAGIRAQAKASGFFLNLQDAEIVIAYDTGPSGTSKGICDAASGEDADINAASGDRVTVTVSKTYTPLVTLLPIQPRTITSTSSRTILGIFELDN
jgi:Flp pilus assembly protein TadG